MNKYCNSLEDAVMVYKSVVEESPYREVRSPTVDLKYQNLVFLLSIAGFEIDVDYEPIQDQFSDGDMEHDIVSSIPLLECNDTLIRIMNIYAIDKLEPFIYEIKMPMAKGFNFSKNNFEDESETPKDHILNIYHILEEIDDPYSMIDFVRVSRRIMKCIDKEVPSYCNRFYPKKLHRLY